MLLGAIEGGGTKFVCGIGTSDGQIVERVSIPTTTPEATLDEAMSFFSNKGIAALGIGTFGPIDVNPQSPAYGSVTSTPKPHWSGYRMLDHVKRFLDIPVGFDTDVNAAALGESVWGAAKGLRNCLYMTVGTGIGVGAIVEGNLVHGLLHPEMGHIVVKRHLLDSYAGNCPFHGDCLEGMASGPAVEKRWERKANELEASHTAWELESYYIGQALANYILTLSPEIIILGGGIMNQAHLFPRIREQVKSHLNRYVQHPVFSTDLETYIVPPALAGNAGLCGALALAKEALIR
ncbi:ROK family protein [Paenibacillus methanolicus]|uniref:fructokinase n=1 Tax=Paenibacillus methanolicus TaxID=582686 RepID=A0A5S5C098_9BACL|nr:ROK family protein [Paenibacillus methanolicus]TYP71886.1 fructokinase [Paenibacillus methanolicus]